MLLELDRAEHDLLAEVIEARIAEIKSEIRRSINSRFHDELVAQRERLEAICRRLHCSAYDVMA